MNTFRCNQVPAFESPCRRENTPVDHRKIWEASVGFPGHPSEQYAGRRKNLDGCTGGYFGQLSGQGQQDGEVERLTEISDNGQGFNVDKPRPT